MYLSIAALCTYETKRAVCEPVARWAGAKRREQPGMERAWSSLSPFTWETPDNHCPFCITGTLIWQKSSRCKH